VGKRPSKNQVSLKKEIEWAGRMVLYLLCQPKKGGENEKGGKTFFRRLHWGKAFRTTLQWEGGKAVLTSEAKEAYLEKGDDEETLCTKKRPEDHREIRATRCGENGNRCEHQRPEKRIMQGP